MNEIQASLAEIPKTRKIVSVSIMFGSIFGIFFVGSYFNLFGTKIDFVQKPSILLFFGFMLTGLFGIFYLFHPFKKAIKSIVKVAALFFAAYLLGKLVRGEL